MLYTKAQRRAKFGALPEALQDIMLSQETGDTIERIAKKNRLLDEQTPKLAREVGTVLLGLIPKEKLAEQLVAEAGLAPEQARAVAGDIEKEIFGKTPSFSQQNPPPTPPPLLKEGAGGGFSDAPKPPLLASPLEGSTPTPVGGRDVSPRPVPIRKIAPPPPNLPTAPLPNLQTLLADIRRGTAFDEARIDSAYRKTPIEIRQSLESIGFLSRLQGVARKFGLNVEETGELVSETGLVLLGLTKPPQFIDNLAKRLRLPRDRAFAVGQAVNMEVLRPVREIIRKMNDGTNYEQDTKIRTEERQSTNEGLKFAPTIQPLISSKNPPPVPSFIKEGERGGGFSPQKYDHDPYRESIE